MELCINYWLEAISAEVIIGGASMGADLTQEQIDKMVKSCLSGKYEYMNEDEDLCDIVAELDAKKRLEGDYDYETRSNILDENVCIHFCYPNEVVEKAYELRRPLSRLEVTYYKGEKRTEFLKDDHERVMDPNGIGLLAQFDIITRHKKRPLEYFCNEAEYRLYLATLYDIAQLDEAV